jgi:hypothetical protein
MSNPDFALPEPDTDETGPYALVGQARARPVLLKNWNRHLLRSSPRHGKRQALFNITCIATGPTRISLSSMKPGRLWQT